MAILTISREIGSDGFEIGSMVAEKMGYEFLDKERILHDLQRDGAIWEKMGKEMDEHAPSLWDRFDRQYLGFIALAKSHILECALTGNVVIMGRGGNFLLDGIPFALRTRVIAPMTKRLKKVTENRTCKDFTSLNPEAARTLLEKSDRESDNLMHSVFGHSWNDPWVYDVVLNMATLEPEDAAEALVSLLMKLDKHKSPTADEELKGRVMAARIKAAIATDPRFLVLTVDVLHSPEGITLKGVVHNAHEHKLIEEEARNIAGAVPVKCELHYR